MFFVPFGYHPSIRPSHPKDYQINMVSVSLSSEGVLHEFSTIEGVKEDVTEIKEEKKAETAKPTPEENTKPTTEKPIEEKDVVFLMDRFGYAKTIDVSDGDIIVMCSDGLVEDKGEVRKDWLENFLKNVNTNNVQKIADLLVNEAIDNSYGVASDDMTVIVGKIKLCSMDIGSHDVFLQEGFLSL